ncbi:MAG: hypothetical protein WCF67_11360 [Chitinophagaceae bacterium]
MRMLSRRMPMLLLFCLCAIAGRAQDSLLYSKLHDLPDKFFNRINGKSKSIAEKLNRQTEKYLIRLEKQERKLQRKLWRKDSVAAKQLFGDVGGKYAELKNNLHDQHIYSGRIDSMQTALLFLDENKLLSQSSLSQEKLSSVLNSYNSLQSKMNYAAAIKNYLKERQQYLQEQLPKFGLSKEFKRFKKEIYYYRAQVDEYKRMLEDPWKFESKLLRFAGKIPAFKEFFRKNSMLASMFRLPGSEPIASAAPIPGLQTRVDIQQIMMQRFGNGPDVNRAMQQNIRDAQSQIEQLKNKVMQLGGSSSEMDMPDFKPNKQKVKTFWQRVELGANVQSAKSNSFFPVASDLALMAGYKLNNRSTAGLGLSYKMGWGQNFRNIKITHEGIGFRSFFDMQLKGSFYASGGFEYNYQQPFDAMQRLYDLDSWQQSALIGVSKIVAVRSRLFKRTKMQLLWDFLSYQQIPRSQPLKFRIGYHF